jgi:DNA-directed RNA polymerase subunit H (RpoH/RPB5)
VSSEEKLQLLSVYRLLFTKLPDAEVSDTTGDATSTTAGDKNILLIYLTSKYAEIPHNAFTSMRPSITAR